jgi:hypothetical protein
MSNATDVIQAMRQRQRNAVQKTGRRVLFNAAHEPITFTYAATTYTIPPNGPYRMPEDPGVRKYDGTLEVYDIYGIDPKNTRQARISMKRAIARGMTLELPKTLLINSLDIVDHAVRKLGDRGLVCLTGLSEEDTELKKQAQEAYVAFRLTDCERILGLYDARKAVFYAQPRNLDQPPPPMTERETMAAVWLAQWRLGRAFLTNRFVCPAHQCGFQHEDRSLVIAHIEGFHPENSGRLLDSLPKTIEDGRRKKEAGAA